MKFLFINIAGKFNHFHAIQQSWRNWIKNISGSNKKDLRKIKRNFNIMIRKRNILRWIQNFQ